MKKTALVTGILGQDGPYLAKLLLEKDYKVYGLLRRYSNPNFENLEYLGIGDKVDFIEGDLTDEASLINTVKNIEQKMRIDLALQVIKLELGILLLKLEVTNLPTIDFNTRPQ